MFERITHSRDCNQCGAFWRRVAQHIGNARKVPARFEGDLAFPRYFVCPRPYVARPNDAFHYNAANSAAYRSAHLRWLSGPRLSAPIQARAKASLAIMARAEGRICMVGHRATETGISAEYSRFCFTAKVKTQLRLAHRLCDCRWNRWAWEVVSFE
jgi:hypothetical protein